MALKIQESRRSDLQGSVNKHVAYKQNLANKAYGFIEAVYRTRAYSAEMCREKAEGKLFDGCLMKSAVIFEKLQYIVGFEVGEPVYSAFMAEFLLMDRCGRWVPVRTGELRWLSIKESAYFDRRRISRHRFITSSASAGSGGQ